jgi:hypothetical protein
MILLAKSAAKKWENATAFFCSGVHGCGGLQRTEFAGSNIPVCADSSSGVNQISRDRAL